MGPSIEPRSVDDEMPASTGESPGCGSPFANMAELHLTARVLEASQDAHGKMALRPRPALGPLRSSVASRSGADTSARHLRARAASQGGKQQASSMARLFSLGPVAHPEAHQHPPRLLQLRMATAGLGGSVSPAARSATIVSFNIDDLRSESRRRLQRAFQPGQSVSVDRAIRLAHGSQ